MSDNPLHASEPLRRSKFHSLKPLLFSNLLMKTVLFLIATAVISLGIWRANQRHGTHCDDLAVDIANGTVGGLSPEATPDEIKARFPCFTGTTSEGGGFNEGGGVFFKNHDMYFYTQRDYIEIRQDFTGVVPDNLLSKGTKQVRNLLGPPISSEQSSGIENGAIVEQVTSTFQTPYGRLVVVSTPSRVRMVQIHAVSR